MSAQAINDALDARVGQFSIGGPIQYEGVPFTPISGKPYLSVRMAAYSRQPVSAGPTPTYQESGTYVINVTRPSGEGKQPAGQVADALVAFFPRTVALSTPGGQQISLLSASAAPAILTGDWITIPVMISWFASDP